MMRANFNNYTCLGPLARVISCLILDCNMVTWVERRKGLAASSQLFRFLNVTLCIGCCSGFCSLPPFWSKLEFPRLKWKEITKDTAKHDLGWRKSCDRAGCVSVCKKCTSKLVSVKTASLGKVPPD